MKETKEVEVLTEEPKRFGSVEAGINYHKDNKVIGWFFVEDFVFWCYANGNYCLTTLRPIDLMAKQAVNIIG